jgi:hypothetical protein
VIRRRDILAAALLGAGVLSGPASACRAPRPKDRLGYARVIDSLFAAWWARDFAAFQRPFQHPERTEPFNARPLFDAQFTERRHRFRGDLLFTGNSVATQVIEPEQADPEHGICGGSAMSHLLLVKFFPGIETPVIEEVRYLDYDLLAQAEWTALAGAHRV